MNDNMMSFVLIIRIIRVKGSTQLFIQSINFMVLEWAERRLALAQAFRRQFPLTSFLSIDFYLSSLDFS